MPFARSKSSKPGIPLKSLEFKVARDEAFMIVVEAMVASARFIGLLISLAISPANLELHKYMAGFSED